VDGFVRTVDGINSECRTASVHNAGRHQLRTPGRLASESAGQSVGKAFGVVYAFTDDVRKVYDGFGLDIPSKNGSPDDWSLPLSATYVIGCDGVIQFADTRVDYRERTDPQEVLRVLEHRIAAE
jgi:peroxiredoxin